MISEKLLVFLTSWIIENTEFSKKIDAPQFFALSQTEMSQKACFSSDNCKVKAYYVKSDGIYFINDMEPEKNICDQSIILHEMVHHYQKNSKRSFDLDERTLWTLQERQAIYYQNLFLISQKRKNDNKGPENVIQCEGGSYLDLQYEYQSSTQ
ncbi:MAG: hypothetical protein CNE97_02530 [alpha proteobacterium MED-G10]|nr:MAG: hypothetical protein CNE97_02530 [alpha proteobacterium MED-G10]|tara:strand:+ start:324 stop:782 length:459 start_codon:yes stop_codon:yes gene_type:complete